ncbi:MAG: lipopolysaccharide export system protein LptA [Verrucomicrobiota bacterium]|jgi:lipopolysaccharide transport protein LptA|nr:lipopolysaccharide export system protein LptA [Verrucomicrobiota bacterium]MDK2963558.1 lipopolysaccharide export system protein LptA [Verrucomicrobiota bacterium]
MRFFSGYWKILLTISMLAASVAAQELPGMEISGFRVPEYDAQGNMTSQVFGDRAEMEQGDEVKITGLRIKFYKQDETVMDVVSPLCFYNQRTKEARSDEIVEADMDRMHLHGRGFLLKSDKETIQVMNDSRMTIQDIMQEVEPSASRNTNEVTVITSRKLFLNRPARTVRFEQNVHVQNPKLQVDCDTLEVRLSESNEVDLIEARGNVRTSHGNFQNTAQQTEPDAARSTNEVIVIAAEELFVDYQARIVRFKQNVHVQDPKFSMDSDTLEARLSESNEINWIEALGNVKILHQGREADAGRAVYDAQTDEFLLERNPKIIEGRNILTGERIRFWRASGRVVCEQQAHLVIYPDDEMKADFFEK